MGLRKTFTSVAAPMICKLLTEKLVMGLPLLIFWGNTLEDWVNLAQNNIPGIISDKREWYPLRRHNTVPRRLSEIQLTPLQGHPVLTSAFEPIVVVTMRRVAARFKSVFDQMTYGTDFNLINLLHPENVNLTHEDLNTSIDKPENRLNIHLELYDTSTSRAKPSSNDQLLHCSWSFGIVNESHRYKTQNRLGWRISMNARNGFNLQVTATTGFHSLYDWCFRMLALVSGAPEDPDDETVIGKHSTKALHSAVRSLMHDIRTEDQDAQQDAAHRMI